MSEAGPCVTILMGLFNGAAHLAAQLDSLAAQTHANWRLIVSDDGSTDAGPQILSDFAATRPPGQVVVQAGPRQGFARNYLAMIRSLPEDAGWLAFADQDDIWLPGRLRQGVLAVQAGVHEGAPALHCTRTLIFSGDPGRTRVSRPRPRPPGFGNALVQNIAAGNTILLSPAAARILRGAAVAGTETVVAHDWWAYQLISGARGGVVLHDDRPGVLYRQHGANLIGSNDGLLSKLARLRLLMGGTMRGWTDVNLAALDLARPWLSDEAHQAVEDLRALRAMRGPLARLAAFRRLGLYRQTRSSTLALWVAVVTDRL